MADTSLSAVPLDGRSQGVDSGPVRSCGPVPFAMTLFRVRLKPESELSDIHRNSDKLFHMVGLLTAKLCCPEK